jgi:hypothetical protein
MFKGCRHEAHFAPKLIVPARGYLKGAGEIEVFIGLECCESHFDEVRPDALLVSADLRADLARQHERRHLARPDFSRARIEKVSVNSRAFIEYKRKAHSAGMT